GSATGFAGQQIEAVPGLACAQLPAHSGHSAGAAVVYLDPQRPAEFAALRVVLDADLDLANLTLMSPLGASRSRRDKQGDDPDDRGRRQHGTRITHQQ